LAGGLVLTLWTMCSTVRATDPPATESAVFLKAQRVQKLVPEWIAAGGNPDEVVPLLKKVDEYVKAGRPDEVGKILDQILAIVEAPRQAVGGLDFLIAEQDRHPSSCSGRGQPADGHAIGIGDHDHWNVARLGAEPVQECLDRNPAALIE